ncbi:MAG: site-specific integrase [Sedimenticola sp.]
MAAALAPSTLDTYRRAWNSYQKFSETFLSIPVVLPLSVSQLSLFVAYLHHDGFATKTISTYLSAIGYVHKLNSFPDPATDFLVKKLVAGAYRLRPSFDVRLPITVPVLNKLNESLSHVTTSLYEQYLFRSMFLLAFSAFARIGEITLHSSGNSCKTMQLADVSIIHNQSVEVTFRFYKHNIKAVPHTVSFSHGPTTYSAVRALETYLAVRGKAPGPLFLHHNKKPVTRGAFDHLLHRALAFCRLDSSRYKGHSFRIGAATVAAQNNLSDAQIRDLGRWSSNAFRRYIRFHV